MLKIRFSLALALLATTSAFGAGLGTMPLAAHRAVYDLTLDSASNDKGPSAARGRIAYDFSGSSCEGYVSNFRQMTQVTPTDAAPRLSDMSTETFEDGAGTSFTFKVESTMDDKTDQNVDGKAKIGADGAISVDLRRPKPEKAEIGKNILFPTDHLVHILAAAKAGKSTLTATVYDGSETGKKVFDTLTVIGKAITTPAPEAPAQIAALDNVPRWPVTISYFSEGHAKESPDYVLSFDLYENGISRQLKLDYGSFILDGTLVKLDLLPAAAPCKTP